MSQVSDLLLYFSFAQLDARSLSLLPKISFSPGVLDRAEHPHSATGWA